MVDVFGNEIIKAYTGGIPVKEIYAYGVLVWPTGYYINWLPTDLSGTFIMEDQTYNFEDYSGSFRFSGGVITSSAFQSTSVEYINTNARYVYNNAFAFCSSMSQAYIESCSVIGANAFTNCTSLEYISAPSCVWVGGNAFESCRFSELYFPLCENIEGNGFRHCKSLTTIDFPVCSVVKQYAFQDCTSLTTISLPVCQEIEQGAFGGDRNLQSVNLPECSVIGSSAFAYCSALQSLNLPSCTTIRSSAFTSCYSLNTVSLPEVQSLGSYAFGYCSALETISLPKVKSIYGYGFVGCTSLKSVYLGDCNMISGRAFYNDTKFSYLELSGSSMCVLNGNDQFYNTPFANCSGTIVVPTSLYTTYINDSKWASLSCVIQPSSRYRTVKCIYQSATSFGSAPQIRVPVPVSQFIMELDIAPSKRDNEILFTYGQQGYVDTIYCYIDYDSSALRNKWHLECGDNTVGGTGFVINESDVSRGVLKWDCFVKSNNKPYITWKSVSDYTQGTLLQNVILAFLKSNTGYYASFGTYVSLGKIYGVVIKDQNSNVIMNLVPTLDEVTGLAGLYDEVNGVFYQNGSSGTVLYESL